MTTKPRSGSRTSVQQRRDLPLDANALELFAHIVAAGSFAQAARDLGQTRAAVSRRVALIEAALGQPLFARTTRALGLTETGRRLATQARAVAEAAAAARQSFRTPGVGPGLGGTLRITAVPTFGHNVLAPLLARFQALHPALRLELSFTHRRIDLLREEVDVAFRFTRRPPQDWVARALCPVAVRAYAAPRTGLPLAGPEALARQALLVLGLPADSVALRWLHDDGASRLLEVTPACVSDEMATLVTMACHGSGIVFAPDFSVQRELASGALADVLPGWRLHLPEGDAVYALTLPHPTAPAAARVLVQFVAEALSGAATPAPGR
ncbi:LysR family transcriptional regulator [Rubrivivax sp. RP6-9]|uniref:LysR family transcriptional regulator n=1 Tax=Rubrivivax sp. RP6-9 TaxID=3415750 RepID=UPI003CC5684C